MKSKAGKIRTAVIASVVFLALLAVGVYSLIVISDRSMYELKLSQHPLSYSEYVEKYSEEYGIDKYVIYAVIKTESGFDPNAVSDTGARGLMQIMEPTFDWINYRLGDGETVVYDDMFDPGTNIRYGAYLMDYLTDYFGCVDTAAAAYFSGIGQVSEWVGSEEFSKDGIHLDTIPSKSAAHYVNKINNALTAYYELYAGERN